MDEDEIAAERRRAEAAQWFARLKTLPVSEGTLKDFFAWRRQEKNAQAFEEAERFWTEAGKVGDHPSILRAVEEAAVRGRSRRCLRLSTIIPILAMLVVAVTVGIHYVSLAGSTYRTDPGEQRAVALEDGSRLRLNTDTRVRVRYGSDRRKLMLEQGEALFNVAHDPARPFIVTVGQASVTATGTQFDVTRLRDSIAVTLIEGRVSITAPDGSSLWLRPGEQWRWPANGREVHAVNASNVLAWTQGRIVFDGRRLEDAISEVNRYGGQPIILEVPAMAGERISGTFEAGDTQSFARAVTAFLPLRQAGKDAQAIHLVAANQDKGKISSP
jgi:transmembrane sensor